jgi:hypothetical protein
VSASPSSLSFNSVVINTTSTAQAVTIQNTGSTQMTFVSIALTGQYSDTTTCGATLAGNASCTVNISFAPTALGVQNGTLTVTDNATGSPQTVSLSGTGISGGGGSGFAIGWTSVAGTNYGPLCPNAGGARPDVQGQSGCGAVMDAWAGGTADTKRNRLLFMGGGHHDYYGNELYSFDPVAGTISRLYNASDVSNYNTNTTNYETNLDGTASTRHTYGGIAYDPTSDTMMLEGGGIPGVGVLSNHTWLLTLNGLSPSSTSAGFWADKAPTQSGGSLNSQFGNLLAYDPNTDSMMLWEAWQSQPGHLWSYNRGTNTWTLLATYGSNPFMDGTESGAIDRSRSLFFAVGNGKLLKINIANGSNYAVSDMAPTATGCSTAVSGDYSGVDFDTSDNTIVIWRGGNIAYSYNPTSNTCTAETYSGGPPSQAQNGTFGRLIYFPTLGIHAVCNNLNANCFILRRSVDVAMTNSWQNIQSGINVPGGAASIVNTQTFDTFPTTNIQHYFNLFKPAQVTTDCTNAADGCSLEFTMNPGDFQGEPGTYLTNFNSTNTALYGQNSEFYIQMRVRYDPAMLLSSTWTNFEGSKIFFVSEGDSATSGQVGGCSNTPTDTVIQNGTSHPGFPIEYWNCGNAGTLKFLDSSFEPVQLSVPAQSDFLDQDAAGCPHYGLGGGTGSTIPHTDPTCWNFVGNEWYTIQLHVKVGTWNTATSVDDLWFCHQAQPCQLVINGADIATNDNGPSVTDKFGKITIGPYATNATWQTTTHVWYDDLVISNRRIPDPNVNTPNEPDSLSLSAISTAHITVNWRVNSFNGTPQDDTGFLIERCTGTVATCLSNPQSGFSQIGTTAPHATSFTDSSVTTGHTYVYRVRAKNQYGNSGYATSVCFNTALPSSGASVCGAATI